MEPWLPDYVAKWYDEFSGDHADKRIQDLRRTRADEIAYWVSQLLEKPHAFAAELDERIRCASDEARPAERYRCLQAASEAFEDAGISPVRQAPRSWSEIRVHWRGSGRLNRSEAGLLLPRRERPFPWLPKRRERHRYEAASHFEGFLRIAPADLHDIHDIQVRVAYDLDGRSTWSDRLVVAFAPLIDDLADLVFTPIDDAGGRRAFRVSLVDEHEVIERARRCITEASSQGVDLLVLPELCLSPAAQQALARHIEQATNRAFYPVVVVAGSAHTPCETAHGCFHNRALVFDNTGTEVLRHNKLFPYVISVTEQGRYGLADALGELPREEDIVATPRHLEILESPLGRLAVLICEDLSRDQIFGPLADKLELDWIIVPVMDGVQTSKRWTATFASKYAERQTIVVVNTCGALVAPHREFSKDKYGSDPGPGTGLLFSPSDVRSGTPQIVSKEAGDFGVIFLR
jgi:predicted amidohydrolase